MWLGYLFESENKSLLSVTNIKYLSFVSSWHVFRSLVQYNDSKTLDVKNGRSQKSRLSGLSVCQVSSSFRNISCYSINAKYVEVEIGQGKGSNSYPSQKRSFKIFTSCRLCLGLVSVNRSWMISILRLFHITEEHSYTLHITLYIIHPIYT